MGKTFKKSVWARTNDKTGRHRKKDRRRLRSRNRKCKDEWNLSTQLRKSNYSWSYYDKHGYRNSSSISNMRIDSTDQFPDTLTITDQLVELCATYDIKYNKASSLTEQIVQTIEGLETVLDINYDDKLFTHKAHYLTGRILYLQACLKQLTRRGALTPFKGHMRACPTYDLSCNLSYDLPHKASKLMEHEVESSCENACKKMVEMFIVHPIKMGCMNKKNRKVKGVVKTGEELSEEVSKDELELPTSGRRPKELPTSGRRPKELPTSGRRPKELPLTDPQPIMLPLTDSQPIKLPHETQTTSCEDDGWACSIM